MTVTRLNGFANPVALTTSAPSGLTVTANPASVTGTTSTLTIAAASSLGAGTYPVTINATASGITQQSVTLPVQVTPSSSGGAITFNFANCEATQIPVWFAAQSGSGPWTRITPTNNAFTFTIGATGAYALVTKDGTATETDVLYGSASEIAAIAIANPCGMTPPTGTKTIRGTLANTGLVDQGVVAKVLVGGAPNSRSRTT